MQAGTEEREVAREGTAIERLRDRTDELELIISSLTILALFNLPGWLFDRFADNYTHLSTGFVIAGTAITTLLSGVCYGLAACFVVHLMARAYWVGLIGLRSAFPDGIDWQRTKNLGPLTREHYRRSLPTQATIIERTDRLASSLFAVISMLTLYALWFGGLLVITMVVSGTIGAQFGATNTALGIASLGLLALFAGVPLLIYVLDAQVAARVRRIGDNGFYVGLIAVLRRISSIAYPERLILPVQLTLQSNTRPFLFFAALTIAIFGMVTVGNFRFLAWRDFTLSSEFTWLGDEEVAGAFRSTYYEDMPSSLDRMRAWPRISSFTQKGSFMRLFLPYQPLRDNLVLRERCGEPGAAADKSACLRLLWSVTIAGRAVSLGRFLPAERADLSMRGLLGVVSLEGLAPGMHLIEIAWNPAEPDSSSIDDRYETATGRFTIPFLFAPEFERALE